MCFSTYSGGFYTSMNSIAPSYAALMFSITHVGETIGILSSRLIVASAGYGVRNLIKYLTLSFISERNTVGKYLIFDCCYINTKWNRFYFIWIRKARGMGNH